MVSPTASGRQSPEIGGEAGFAPPLPVIRDYATWHAAFSTSPPDLHHVKSENIVLLLLPRQLTYHPCARCGLPTIYQPPNIPE